MRDADTVDIRYPRHPSTLVLLALGALALAVGTPCVAYRVLRLEAGAPFHPVDGVAIGSVLFVLLGVWMLRMVTISVRADAYGIHVRTWLRRRRVPWADVADVQELVKVYKSTEVHRVVVGRRRTRALTLPLPQGSSDQSAYQRAFEADLAALRAAHRRYGRPESDHPVVINSRTAGRSWKATLVVCGVLLGCSGVAASFVSTASDHLREWKAAVPCPAGEPDRTCLVTERAVIERTHRERGKGPSYLYFTGDRPVDRVSVDRDAAQDFTAGDRVTLTFWEGGIYRVEGAGQEWTEHFATGGEVAVVSALCALGAGFPASQLVIRRRGRGRPADEVLPSAWPFGVALVGTGFWLLPFVHTLTTGPFRSTASLVWLTVGAPVSLALFVWAWRATRIRHPEPRTAAEPVTGEVFVKARFLDATDYNPHCFGTHILLGAGPPAVAPGPGRFASREIPAGRLALRTVRRPRGPEAELVPRDWEIAELDDAGAEVRLAAAPRDLRRVLGALVP
ncbi:PH domain-containing protein [Streptomyces sp. NPDC050418]|uniref:PH domain-containing protein n=1 Tax=Streptomyces sp. NPDC050418 TaxID=3365612 RepID=UPI0037B2ADA9